MSWLVENTVLGLALAPARAGDLQAAAATPRDRAPAVAAGRDRARLSAAVALVGALRGARAHHRAGRRTRAAARLAAVDRDAPHRGDHRAARGARGGTVIRAPARGGGACALDDDLLDDDALDGDPARRLAARRGRVPALDGARCAARAALHPARPIGTRLAAGRVRRSGRGPGADPARAPRRARRRRARSSGASADRASCSRQRWSMSSSAPRCAPFSPRARPPQAARPPGRPARDPVRRRILVAPAVLVRAGAHAPSRRARVRRVGAARGAEQPTRLREHPGSHAGRRIPRGHRPGPSSVRCRAPAAHSKGDC